MDCHSFISSLGSSFTPFPTLETGNALADSTVTSDLTCNTTLPTGNSLVILLVIFMQKCHRERGGPSSGRILMSHRWTPSFTSRDNYQLPPLTSQQQWPNGPYNLMLFDHMWSLTHFHSFRRVFNSFRLIHISNQMQ